MTVGANNDATRNNNNDDSDGPYGDSKAETILAVMGLENYKPSYDGYAFFQPAAIASGTTSMNKT